MAKAGPRGGTTSPAGAATGRSADTRRALVVAAIETLKAEGFAGASARAIASRAGCNQALVFYHFGSVNDLLLAALDDVSATRLARYRSAVEDVTSPESLVEAAADIFGEDLDAGHVTVLVEMIAGASSVPGLGPAVAERIRPWTGFTGQAVDRVLDPSGLGKLVPSGDVAHGIVALYLGLEMLAHLEGDRAPALALFDTVRRLAPLLALLTDGRTAR